ncbi:LysR family transcriptional regulator [Nonomuraea basaltis]|uniref:LysR family transcriptional regulator n=1 Tax=Nonomuraea basaltis TaxID=2495887 RepID=UPI001981530D|nr:LysR family transcriptional regulator [Nonomuraea basaltis]
MEIRSLRYAVTLAEELHFGRAAQRHFIAPQPFGRHIQRLEREVGRRLFERMLVSEVRRRIVEGWSRRWTICGRSVVLGLAISVARARDGRRD